MKKIYRRKQQMKNKFKLSETAFQLDGRMPLSQAIPLGLQHLLTSHA